MVEALCGALTARGTAAVLVTWVPTALGSRRRRGFDHAEVLARGVAAELGLPAEPLLWRAVPAADQAGLTASQRRTNLSGAFVARPAEGTVLVVDDLVTTGATLEACAAALRSAGVEEAEGAAVCSARAPGPGGPKV
jgi:predicted amidophosphoribosyltransferase